MQEAIFFVIFAVGNQFFSLKRRVYILFVALSAFMLMILPLVPHHHHEMVLCTIVEHCEADDADNDAHTAHNDDGSSCVEKNEFFFTQSTTDFSNPEYHLLPVFIALIGQIAGFELYPTQNILRWQSDVVFYTSSCLTRINALRAPPSVLFS